MSLKKLNLKERKTTLVRRIVQIISFLFINYIIIEIIFSINLYSFQGIVKVLPILNSPRNPLSEGAGILEYIFYTIAQGEFPFLLIGILIVVLLLTNRFFCGWICPIGTIQDGICAIPTKERKFTADTHNTLKNFKYLLVIVIIIVIVPLGFTQNTDLVFYFQYKRNIGEWAQKPMGFFSLSEYIFVYIPDMFTKMWERQSLEPLVEGEFPQNILPLARVIFFIVIIALAVFYPRFYCRYICPFGAVASVVSDYSLLKLSRSPVRCVGRAECGICERVCPMQIKILDEPFEFFTGKGECIYCLKCKERCPYDAIEYKFG